MNLHPQQTKYKRFSLPTETETDASTKNTSPRISKKKHSPQKLAPTKFNDLTVYDSCSM